MFGAPIGREARQLTAVGTTGSGGSGITFAQPTTRTYRLGDPLWEVSTVGNSIVEQSGSRRMDASADYHAIKLVVPGVGGRSVEFGLRKAINVTSPTEFTGVDGGDSPIAPRYQFQSRIDETALTTSPWYINRPA